MLARRARPAGAPATAPRSPTTTCAERRRPRPSCARTGARASAATGRRSRSPARRRGATSTSGTGTRAFTRSPGATSTRERAEQELRTLLRAGRRRRLRPAHGVLAGAAALAPRAALRDRRLPRRHAAPQSIQTPLLALAWERGRAHGDRRLRRRGPRAAAQRTPDWLDRRARPRRRRADHDPAARRVRARRLAQVRRRLRLARALDSRATRGSSQRCRRRAGRAATITRTTDEHVEDVLVNVAHALSLRALHRHDRRAALGRARADAHRAGAARALLGRASAGSSSTSPAATSARSRSRPGPRWRRSRCRAPERHPRAARRASTCSTRAATGARFGVPIVSMEEPSFRPGFNAYRTWRGAAWVNTAWLLVGGLRALGADDEADRIAQAVADARRAQRLPRVLPPAHRLRPRRAPLRLVDARARPPPGFSAPTAGVAPEA